MKPPEVRASLLFNRQMSYFVRNCLLRLLKRALYSSSTFCDMSCRGARNKAGARWHCWGDKGFSLCHRTPCTEVDIAICCECLVIIIPCHLLHGGIRRALMNFLRSVPRLPYSIVWVERDSTCQQSSCGDMLKSSNALSNSASSASLHFLSNSDGDFSAMSFPNDDGWVCCALCSVLCIQQELVPDCLCISPLPEYFPSLSPFSFLKDCAGSRSWQLATTAGAREALGLSYWKRLRIIQSQNILIWKGPISITESNSWPHTVPFENQTICISVLSKTLLEL